MPCILVSVCILQIACRRLFLSVLPVADFRHENERASNEQGEHGQGEVADIGGLGQHNADHDERDEGEENDETDFVFHAGCFLGVVPMLLQNACHNGPEVNDRPVEVLIYPIGHILSLQIKDHINGITEVLRLHILPKPLLLVFGGGVDFVEESAISALRHSEGSQMVFNLIAVHTRCVLLVILQIACH